jgi:cell division septal protein FtsQ
MNWFTGILIGIIVGFVGGVVIDRDTVNKYLIRKIKVKGDGNVTDIDLKDLRKNQREERKRLRKEKRQAKG